MNGKLRHQILFKEEKMASDQADNKKKSTEKLNRSVERLISSIDQQPKNAENYYALGMLLTDAKQYQQAEELFKRAINFFTKEHLSLDLLFYGLGNVLYAAGMYPEAQAYFKQIKQPKLKAAAYLMIAQTYYAQENYQQALVFGLTVAEQTGKNQTDACLIVAESLLALGELTQAANYFDRVLAVSSTNFQANFQRGIIEMVLHRDGDRFFSQAKRINPQKFVQQQQRLTDIERLLLSKQAKAERKESDDGNK